MFIKKAKYGDKEYWLIFQEIDGYLYFKWYNRYESARRDFKIYLERPTSFLFDRWNYFASLGWEGINLPPIN